jgi:HSP20 family protein
MANVMRFDPFAEMTRFNPMMREFEDMLWPRGWRAVMRGMTEVPEIRMDVAEDATAYHVKAEIPGACKEDIKVAIDGNQVSITAEVKKEQDEKKGETVIRSERYLGRQTRTFALVVDVDPDAATAKYQDGVLEITLPKKPDGGAAKQVIVQ